MRVSGLSFFRLTAAGSVLLGFEFAPLPSFAQEATTQQLPLPTGRVKTQSEDKRWQLTFDSAWSYFGTKETFSGLPGWNKSVLNYLPIGMAFVAIPTDEIKIEVGVRSGYIDLHSTSSGGVDVRSSGWTDTSVNTTVTYYGYNGFLPFVSLATNLPTGQSNVSNLVAAHAQDPDVTQIAGFGTGFNLGPTLGVNIPITKDLLATVAGGYTSRGAFQRAGLNSAFPLGFPGEGVVEDFKPGDVTTLNASLGYQSGAWSFQTAGSYSYEAVTKVDGIDFYQTGGKYSFSAALGYAWNDNWSSRVTTSFSHIGKNRYPRDPKTGLDLVQEVFDTNSDMVNVVIDTTYSMGAFAIGPTASFLYRDHNGYDSNTGLFLPAKTKWTAGAAGQYAVTNKASLNARVEHLWLTENENPGPFAPPPAIPRIMTDGWILTFGGKVTF